MRWVFITLVLLNAAYFGWQTTLDKPLAKDRADNFQYGKPLVLVSEKKHVVMLDEPPSRQAIEKQPDTKSEEQQPEIKTEAKAKDEVKLKAKAKDKTKAKAKDEAKTKVQAKAKTTAVKSEAKSVSQPKLPDAPPPNTCYAVGPFLLVTDVSRAARSFEKAGIEAQQRAAAERKQVGFWVYIPPFESLSEARDALRVLKDQELYDALLIAEGVKANSISAGVYHSQALANERKNKIEAMGFAVAIDPLYRTQPQYWLDLEIREGGVIPEKLWGQISRDFPSVERKQNDCQ